MRFESFNYADFANYNHKKSQTYIDREAQQNMKYAADIIAQNRAM